jgi:Ion transport protein
MIFLCEAVSKIIAYTPRNYFNEMGNWFDFLIVLSSIISSIVSIAYNLNFGSATTFIRALRIARIFKYIKKSAQVKIIFETLVITIPSLTNIGGLLLLFLYIYSVLGVFLFAQVQL